MSISGHLRALTEFLRTTAASGAASNQSLGGSLFGTHILRVGGLGVQSTSKVPNWDFQGPYHIDLLGA
jgi:hypothetical protein